MEDTTAQSMNAKLMKAVELVNDVLIEIQELRAPVYRDLDKIAQRIVDALVESGEITDDDNVYVQTFQASKQKGEK